MICRSVTQPYRIVREACIELDSLQLVSYVQAQQCQTRRLASSESVQQEPAVGATCVSSHSYRAVPVAKSISSSCSRVVFGCQLCGRETTHTAVGRPWASTRVLGNTP